MGVTCKDPTLYYDGLVYSEVRWQVFSFKEPKTPRSIPHFPLKTIPADGSAVLI